MKKVIKFNKNLCEDAPILSRGSSTISKGDRRIVRVLRAAESAEEAAEAARVAGNNAAADDLEHRAELLRQWAGEAENDDYEGKGQNSRNDEGEEEPIEAEQPIKSEGESEGEGEDEGDSGKQSNGSKGNSETGEGEGKQQGAKSNMSHELGGQTSSEGSSEQEGQESGEQQGQSGQQQGQTNGNNGQEGQEQSGEEQAGGNEGGQGSQEGQEGERTGGSESGQEQSNGEQSGGQQNGEKSGEERGNEQNDQQQGEQQGGQQGQSGQQNGQQNGQQSSQGQNGQQNSQQGQNSQQNKQNGKNSQQNGQQNSKNSKSMKNPFNLPPRAQQQAQQRNKNNNGGSQPEEPQNKDERVQAMAAVLKQLQGGERDGARKALQDLLGKLANSSDSDIFTESLCEVFSLPNKSLHDISDDELDEIINSVYLDVDKIKPINRSTPMATRVKEIETTAEQAINDINAEDNINLKDERKAARARRRGAAAYAANDVSGLGGLSAFKASLWKAIKNQTKNDDIEDTSWGAINRRHQDDDIIAPGIIGDEKKRKNTIPSIKVYFDCSGSFNEDDINKVKNVLTVLNSFEREKKIIVEPIAYFANHVHDTFEEARNECGTNAWPYIVDELQHSAPTNVIIITDSDMNGDAASLGHKYQARGCAWYIWKHTKAPYLPKYVNGRQGTFEFQLD